MRGKYDDEAIFCLISGMVAGLTTEWYGYSFFIGAGFGFLGMALILAIGRTFNRE